MSQINDALKHAREAAPPTVPQPIPPQGIPLRREAKPSIWSGLGLAGLILCALAGLAWFGWSATHHQTAKTTVVQATQAVQTPAPPPTPIAPPPPPVTVTPVPVAAPPTAVPPTNPPVVPAPPPLPVVQGIFYSPTDPSAIVSGKTVRPGNRLGNYTVKAIDQVSVTLVDLDKKEIKLSIGH